MKKWMSRVRIKKMNWFKTLISDKIHAKRPNINLLKLRESNLKVWMRSLWRLSKKLSHRQTLRALSMRRSSSYSLDKLRMECTKNKTWHKLVSLISEWLSGSLRNNSRYCWKNSLVWKQFSRPLKKRNWVK